MISASAQLHPGRTAVVNRAIDLTIREDYPRALALMDSLIRAEPRRPEGWFFRAAVHSMRMTDEESFRHENRLQADLDSAEVRVARLVSTKGDSADLAFCQASIHSYRAYHASRREQWLRALGHGMKAVRGLEHIRERWPAFPEVELGLGNYYFWRTVKMGSWLPLAGDERDKGIRMVEAARHKGQYNPWVAASNLSWMYLEAGRPREALRVCTEGLSRFPGCRLFLFPLGDAQMALGRWTDARTTWNTVLAQLRQQKPDTGVNRLICHGKLAQVARALGDTAAAGREAREGLAVAIDPTMEFRAEPVRERLQDLLESLEK